MRWRWTRRRARSATARAETLSAVQVSLLSALLYHGLTTGAGVPTLGDEYCSLHLVRAAKSRICPC